MQSGQVCPNCGEYASSQHVLYSAFHCSKCGHESRDEEDELKLAPLAITVQASRSLEDYVSPDPTMAISRLNGRSCHACGQRMLPKESCCPKCGARYSEASVATSAVRLQRRVPNTDTIHGDTGENLTQVIDAIRELLAAHRNDRREPKRRSAASGRTRAFGSALIRVLRFANLAIGSALGFALKLVLVPLTLLLVVGVIKGAYDVSPALGILVLAFAWRAFSFAWRAFCSNQPDVKQPTKRRRGDSPTERATSLLKRNGYPIESLNVLRAIPPILQQRDEVALVMMITKGSHLDMQLAGLAGLGTLKRISAASTDTIAATLRSAVDERLLESSAKTLVRVDGANRTALILREAIAAGDAERVRGISRALAEDVGAARAAAPDLLNALLLQDNVLPSYLWYQIATPLKDTFLPALCSALSDERYRERAATLLRSVPSALRSDVEARLKDQITNLGADGGSYVPEIIRSYKKRPKVAKSGNAITVIFSLSMILVFIASVVGFVGYRQGWWDNVIKRSPANTTESVQQVEGVASYSAGPQAIPKNDDANGDSLDQRRLDDSVEFPETAEPPDGSKQAVRLWTDATTGRSVEAEYLGVEGEVVLLRRTSDSKEFRIPLVRLSTEDQAFAEAQRELPE